MFRQLAVLLITISLIIPSPAKGDTVKLSSDSQTTLYGGLSLNPGWTFLQDHPNFGCVATANSCTFSSYPTTAGSVWIVFVSFGNTSSQHITSVTSSSGSWQTCPAPTCNAFSATHGGVDAIVNFTGTAGSTSGVVNLSANSTGFLYASFIELLPPAGFTASIDVVGTAMTGSCSTSCNGVPLTLTATDAVMQITNAPQLISPSGPFAFSSPYVTDGNSSGLALNVNNASATPTFGFDPLSNTGTSWIGVVGLAFKTTASIFSTPVPVFSFKNFSTSYTLGTGGITGCSGSTTCTFTINTPVSGNLLLLQYANKQGRTLSSVSDPTNGTWTTPTGANTCAISNLTDVTGCSYVVNTGTPTVLTLTVSGTTSEVDVAVYEVARLTGTWTLDAQGSSSRSASSNVTMQSLAGGCTGCSGAITGTNDVIFHQVSMNGGPSGMTLAAQPFINKGNNSFGGGWTFALNYANTGIMLNTANATAPFTTGPSNPAVVGAIAFK